MRNQLKHSHASWLSTSCFAAGAAVVCLIVLLRPAESQPQTSSEQLVYDRFRLIKSSKKNSHVLTGLAAEKRITDCCTRNFPSSPEKPSIWGPKGSRVSS